MFTVCSKYRNQWLSSTVEHVQTVEIFRLKHVMKNLVRDYWCEYIKVEKSYYLYSVYLL